MVWISTHTKLISLLVLDYFSLKIYIMVLLSTPSAFQSAEQQFDCVFFLTFPLFLFFSIILGLLKPVIYLSLFLSFFLTVLVLWTVFPCFSIFIFYHFSAVLMYNCILLWKPSVDIQKLVAFVWSLLRLNGHEFNWVEFELILHFNNTHMYKWVLHLIPFHR